MTFERALRGDFDASYLGSCIYREVGKWLIA